MPFRCKCGRTFEKVETFGSHTSGCATFHHRRVSTSDINKQQNSTLTVQTSPDFFSAANNTTSEQRRLSSLFSPTYSDYFFRGFSSSNNGSPPNSAPITEATDRFSFMMPTALSIHNTFEGVQRKRSMSYTNTATTNAATAAYK